MFDAIDCQDRCAVIVPYKDCSEVLSKCLDSLLKVLPDSASVVLIDDGSKLEASVDPKLQAFLQDPHVCCLRHLENRGPAAARNTGVRWCWEQGIELVILLDSDCLVGPGFVETHCALHQQYPDVVCIGGAIHGIGKGLWAKLDGLMSWFTSVPNSEMRDVAGVYHIPTTNMSIKLNLSSRNFPLFENRLKTGEDVVFCKRLQSDGGKILFSPNPEIRHLDRTSFRGFLRHQYRWGLHTYVVRFGDRNWGIAKRLILALSFIFLLPAYALLASLINVLPWLKQSFLFLKYYPLILIVYLIKGFAVIEGICFPNTALYPSNFTPTLASEKLIDT